MKTNTKTILLSFVLLLSNCKEKSIEKEKETSIQNAVATIEDTSNYHTDTTYQYENRTGTSGNYKYNYDVIGFDSNGNDITGYIAIEGKKELVIYLIQIKTKLKLLQNGQVTENLKL